MTQWFKCEYEWLESLKAAILYSDCLLQWPIFEFQLQTGLVSVQCQDRSAFSVAVCQVGSFEWLPVWSVGLEILCLPVKS